MADLGTCTSFIFSAVSLCKCTCTHLLSFRSVLWPPLHYRCSQFLWIFLLFHASQATIGDISEYMRLGQPLKHILKIYLYITLGLYPCVACLYIYELMPSHLTQSMCLLSEHFSSKVKLHESVQSYWYWRKQEVSIQKLFALYLCLYSISLSYGGLSRVTNPYMRRQYDNKVAMKPGE